MIDSKLHVAWLALALALPAERTSAQHIGTADTARPSKPLGPKSGAAPWMQWPFAADTEVKIFQTYGQSEHAMPTQVHMGLDLAVAPGTPLYSPVNGEVTMLFLHGFQPHHRGIGIRTWHQGTEVIVQLLHLKTHSIQVTLGDKVEVGDLLGKIHPWPNEEYPTHLHMAMGLGSLTADGQVFGSDDDIQLGLNPSEIFTENTNPLLHLQAPPDEVPPVCVSLGDPATPVEAVFAPGGAALPVAPFAFHAVEGQADDWKTWKRSEAPLDPSALRGLVDIEFAIRDLHTEGVDYALAPLAVHLTIHRGTSEDGAVVLDRKLRLDGRVCGVNSFPRNLYFSPVGKMRKDHTAFIFHLTSLNGLGGLEEKPALWATEPGRYLVVLRAGDPTHKHVLIGQQVVNVLPR